MMLTFRAGKLAALMVSVAMLVACSREQQDWRSAEASDTVEGYGQFLQRHPDSELATEARTRVAQLSEDREWQSAGNADTADAYKQFLAQHPNGQWAQEARIRMENFALGREGAAAVPGVSAAVSADGPVGAAGSAGSRAGTGSGTTGGATTDTGAESTVASAWRGSGGDAAQVAPGEPARPPAPGSMSSGPTAQVTPLPPQGSSGDMARSQPSRQPLPATSTSAAASAPNASGTSAVAAASTQVPPQASPTLASAWRSDPGFGVQLGAFTSENAATSEWQQLTSRFSAQLRGLAPRVVSADTSTGRLFRLQALVADEAAARTLCDMLRKQSQACVPVLPH